MSTYFVDFSADTLDAYPSGWTHTWVDASSATETKVIAGGADRVFQIGGNSGADNLHTLNAVDADANRATVDVVTRFQIDELTPGTYPLSGLALRAASGTPGDGYWAGPIGGTACRIAKLSGGTKSPVGGSGSFTFVAATWYKMRFQASGTSLKFKIWADADAEPGTWLIEATDSTFTGAGAVGVYQAGATHEPIFDFVGVGTNGDAAPMSGATSVTSDLVATYAVVSAAAQDLAAAYAVRGPVEQDLVAAYAVRVLVTDDANRADGAIGANYTNAIGAGLLVSGNKFIGVNAQQRASLRTAETYEADQFGELTIGAFDGVSWVGVMLRTTGADGTRNGYMVDAGSNGTYYVTKYVNGVETNFIEGSGVPWAPGDRLRGEVTGSLLKIFRNGTLLDSHSDGTYTSGAPGLFTYSAQAFDDVVFGPVASLASVQSDLVATYTVAGPPTGKNEDFSGNLSEYTQLHSNAVVISGGQLTGVSAAETGIFHSAGTYGGNQFSSHVVRGAPSSGMYWTAGVRYTRTSVGNFTGYRGSLGGQGYTYISRVTAGAGTDLASGNIGRPLVSGDVIEFSAIGTFLRLRLNGTTVLTATDATHSSGKPGIELFNVALLDDAAFGETGVTSDLAATYDIEASGGTTAVTSDLVATYTVVAGVQQDLAAAYAVRGPVGQDLVATYTVVAGVSQDFVATYTVVSAAAQDLVSAYAVRGPVEQDLVAAYAVRGAVAQDLTSGYAVQAAAAQDLAASYAVRIIVESDLSAAYGLRGIVTSDLAAAYEVLAAGSVTRDLAVSFDIVGTAASDLVAAYGVLNAAEQDLDAIYAVQAAAAQDLAASYAVRGAATKDIAAEYALLDAVEADLAAEWAMSGAVASDLVAAYSVYGGGGSGASAAEVAEAVWKYIVEGGLTAERMQRVMFAALAGKSSGVGTDGPEVYYGRDGTTPRLTVTFDAFGNRETVAVNGA